MESGGQKRFLFSPISSALSAAFFVPRIFQTISRSVGRSSLALEGRRESKRKSPRGKKETVRTSETGSALSSNAPFPVRPTSPLVETRPKRAAIGRGRLSRCVIGQLHFFSSAKWIEWKSKRLSSLALILSDRIWGMEKPRFHSHLKESKTGFHMKAISTPLNNLILMILIV